MDMKFILFGAYAFIGLLLIIFNKYVSEITYNLVLYFTEKLDLQELFLFKIDETNRNSMFSLMRTFTTLFGILIVTTCLYYMYY